MSNGYKKIARDARIAKGFSIANFIIFFIILIVVVVIAFYIINYFNGINNIFSNFTIP